MCNCFKTKDPIRFAFILNKLDKFPDSYDPSGDELLVDFVNSLESPAFCSGLTGLGKTEVLRMIGEKISLN